MQNNKLVTVQSPLSALGEFEIPVGITLAEVHARYGSALPTVLVLNGAPVMRAEWHRVVTEGDAVALAVFPAKGGFKQILGAVALIALAVVAPGIGTAIAGSGIAGNLAAAGIVLAGSLLINALLAPKTTKTPADVTSVSNSPTYSLSSEGNQARLLQPIPRLYGRHIINADFAAKPYVFFEKNDQYLCQLFCLGVGLYDLEEIRIDKTTLWRNGAFTGSYAQVEIQKVEPGQTVTLFRPEVETSSEVSGQELVRLFNANVNVDFQLNTMFSVGGPGTPDTQQFFGNYRAGDVLQITQSNSNNGFYNIIDVDKVNNSWIQVDRAFPRQGTDNGINFNSEGYVGPFTTNPANTQINVIQIDLSFPEGSWAITGYQQNGNPNYTFPTQHLEIQWRKINSIGQPLTDWVSRSGPSDPTMSFSYPTFNERRETRTFDVEPGRYEVRVRRITQKLFQQTAHNTINWVGLKAFYSGVTNSYPDVTTIAIKIRADNQISSQTSRKFSFIQTAKIPSLQGDLSFSAPAPTRKICDAFLDAAMNPVYGAGMPASRIDIQKFLELQDTWNRRGDTFDGVFDSKYTMWDALTAILFVGRAKPLLIGGVLTAVRDQPRALPRGVFTPQNMLPGSLEIDHVMYDENSPTDAKVSFIDERTWSVNEVECFIDDDDRDNPVTINGFGIVKREHAWREGIYQVASNKYRRIFATFGTEMEGKLLIPLDKVVINHDLPRYGQSGSLVDLSSDAIFWRSTEPLTMPTGGAVAALRTRTGGLWGPVTVAEVSEEGTLIRLNPQSLFDVSAVQGSAVDFVNVGYNNDGEPAAILFGTTDSYSKAFRVISAIPRSETQISILCTNEDNRVHTAETDYLMPSEDGLASLI